jgi:hypothetical protein
LRWRAVSCKDCRNSETGLTTKEIFTSVGGMAM